MFPTQFIAASTAYSDFGTHVPAPYFRKSFNVRKPVNSARITVCGLGFYEIYINGQRRTKGLLAPYISNPDDILYYDHYDLTADLRSGKNTLGFLLGNGMLNCPGGTVWDFHLAPYRSAPKLAVLLELQYEDGETEQITGDTSFRTHPSPILFDDLRCGEIYDARNEIPHWNLPEFDDSHWDHAIPAQTPLGEPRLCQAEPIVTVQTLSPVSIRESHITYFPAETKEYLPNFPLTSEETQGYLYDFGQNLAGNIRLKIKGMSGQTVAIQFGELLAPDGGLDLRGMNFLPYKYNQRISYTLRGDGAETYAPTFSYQGFRYCLVSGITPEQATPELLTYEVMSSALKRNGTFACSDPVANQLQQAVCNSDISNFYYFPTDCPHREKNGWTADAALSAEQMLFNLTPENSYHEWLHNIRRAQRPDGALPGIIPTSGWGFAWGNGPAWDSALFWLPYYTWLYRNDTAIILENADAFIRYLHYIDRMRDEVGLVHIGLGDWLHIGRGTPKAPLEVTDTLTCIDLCQKAEKMLHAVQLCEQAGYARDLGRRLRMDARKHLLTDSLTVLGHCQTSQAMALAYGLFDDKEKDGAFQILLDLIHEQDDHLDTGCLGGRLIFHVLSEFGQAELAYHMIVREDHPSYGHWVIHENCTSLFEAFQTDAEIPNSKNHHFWGDISSWFLKNLAGIRVNPYTRDANELLIAPHFLDGMEYAQGEIGIPAGKVSVAWHREGNDVILQLQIPSNAYGRLQPSLGYQFNEINEALSLPLRSGTYRLSKTFPRK